MVLLALAGYFPVLFMFFDAYYFLRTAIQVAYTKYFCKRTHPLEEHVTTGMCTTTDLDFMLHMNNARYLRECDFARFHLWMRCGIWDASRKLGCQVTLGCSTVRYRKSLQLGDLYNIRSKILCWDDQAFYVEQKIERTSDNFLCALVWIKQTFKKKSPDEVMAHVVGEAVPSPDFPEEISLWIEAHKVSSEKLKKMRNIEDNNDPRHS